MAHQMAHHDPYVVYSTPDGGVGERRALRATDFTARPF